MFVINLAVFDLTMMLEMPLLITNSFYQRPVGYQLGCDIYAVLGSLSGIGGAITNAVIAFDRYKYVFHFKVYCSDADVMLKQYFSCFAP